MRERGREREDIYPNRIRLEGVRQERNAGGVGRLSVSGKEKKWRGGCKRGMGWRGVMC